MRIKFNIKIKWNQTLRGKIKRKKSIKKRIQNKTKGN